MATTNECSADSTSNDRNNKSNKNLSGAEEIVERHNLAPHPEGGYFRRFFQADHRPKLDSPRGPRFTMTSIIFVLTSDNPICHFHRDRSDIIHIHQGGAPIRFYIIYPDGTMKSPVLGPDHAAGQQMQLPVPGGNWKASHIFLEDYPGEGEYAFTTEVVSPGFEYDDMDMGKTSDLIRQYPQHEKIITRLSRELPGPVPIPGRARAN